jgi:exodeoxyribonuclease-3
MATVETGLAILTLNVCSPSTARAERQLEWLERREEQVFVLTEVSGGSGSGLIGERLRAAGWQLRAPQPRDGERGVMICSRVVIGDQRPAAVEYLRERAARVTVGEVDVIGVYAPSRDDSVERVARKRRFLSELLSALGQRGASTTVLVGDLNIVERSGRASDRLFQEWEYELYEELPRLGWLDAYRALHPDRVEMSWADGEGRGFRFDHSFITADLRERLERCEYLHETREEDLSDHSAMMLELGGIATSDLDVDTGLSGGPPSLF